MPEIEYNAETLEDMVFNEIKDVCFMFLEGEDSINEIEDAQVYVMAEFLNKKYIDVEHIMSSMKIKSYYQPFREISEALDEITMGDTLLVKKTEPVYYKLTKDTNYTLENIGFCYGIVNKILEKRNLDY